LVELTDDPSGTDLSFRPASVDDAETVADIAASAFGPSRHRASEIRRYLRWEPNYWVLAEFRGQPAGVVGSTDYGPFAYIGMMTVRKELQRRGIGGAVFRRLLEWLDEAGVSFLRLDATEEGFPIYAGNGFEVVDRAVRVEHPEPPRLSTIPGPVRLLGPSDLDDLVAFDTPIFGAERAQLFGAFLEDFPDRSFLSTDGSGQITGFLFAQHRRLGPWVARSSDDAEALLQAALTLSFQGLPAAVAPGANPAALELLDRFGFVWKRESRHMQRGGSGVPGDRAAIFGLTSFAVG
jgi:GNAT superfamily N-acetyltransferase